MRISDRRSAFTLLEVILATVITAITMAALTMTFRTAVNAWRTGHGMAEIMQTARITQEVMLRDLDNMIYQNESNYNRTFRQQITQLAARAADPEDIYGRDRLVGRLRRTGTRPATEDPMAELGAESIAMPLDVSLRGDDGDELDRLSFARHYVPRRPSDPATWGVRRVSYYVSGGTLYREESDPFGFRPGEAAADYYFSQPEMVEALSPFLRPVDGAEARAREFLPESLRYNVAEPMCEGVELLNVTYGYFRDYEWQEVDDWDSGAQRYRNPPEESEITQAQAMERVRANPGSRMFGIVGYDAVAAAIVQASRNQPDDLPGYIAIQLGVRAPEGKGRLYSFTFYYSVPQALETDQLAADDPMRGMNIPISGRYGSSSLGNLRRRR